MGIGGDGVDRVDYRHNEDEDRDDLNSRKEEICRQSDVLDVVEGSAKRYAAFLFYEAATRAIGHFLGVHHHRGRGVKPWIWVLFADFNLVFEVKVS